MAGAAAVSIVSSFIAAVVKLITAAAIVTQVVSRGHVGFLFALNEIVYAFVLLRNVHGDFCLLNVADCCLCMIRVCRRRRRERETGSAEEDVSE